MNPFSTFSVIANTSAHLMQLSGTIKFLSPAIEAAQSGENRPSAEAVIKDLENGGMRLRKAAHSLLRVCTSVASGPLLDELTTEIQTGVFATEILIELYRPVRTMSLKELSEKAEEVLFLQERTRHKKTKSRPPGEYYNDVLSGLASNFNRFTASASIECIRAVAANAIDEAGVLSTSQADRLIERTQLIYKNCESMVGAAYFKKGREKNVELWTVNRYMAEIRLPVQIALLEFHSGQKEMAIKRLRKSVKAWTANHSESEEGKEYWIKVYSSTLSGFPIEQKFGEWANSELEELKVLKKRAPSGSPVA